MSTTMTIDQLREKLEALFKKPDTFKAWLDRRQKNDVVGKTNTDNSCPLAAFAKDKGLLITVEREYLEVYDEYGNHLMTTEPDWAKRFVREVDTYGGFDPSNGNTQFDVQQVPVTARQAKDALERALA